MYRVIDTSTDTILQSSNTLWDITEKYLDIVIPIPEYDSRRTSIGVFVWSESRRQWEAVNI